MQTSLNELFRIDWRALIGFVAGALATSAGVPQLFKAWKTRSTRDLSLVTLLMANAGTFLWLVYGVSVLSLPLILANGIGLTVLATTLGLKLKYK